jgi:hypothetical protein
MQATGANPRIDSAGKRLKFNDSYTLAREVSKAFAPAGFLNAANVHEEA